jgi:recombination protein RecT
MSKEDCEAHGKKYSQTYKRGGGLWASDFVSMSKKTCLKQLLSKFGIMSIEMQRAQIFDQAVVKNDLINENVDEAEVEYVDNNPAEARRNAIKEALQEAEVVDTETGEILK